MRIILLSGISGSGKSTIAKSLGGSLTVVCSADDYFVDVESGEYRFDPSKLSEAHGACLKKFVSHLLRGEVDTIIVDNTNLTALELAPYVALAQAYRAATELVTFPADVDLCAKRNLHGVPIATLRRMAKTLSERVLPVYWNIKQSTI